jgi:hypothetical protein
MLSVTVAIWAIGTLCIFLLVGMTADEWSKTYSIEEILAMVIFWPIFLLAALIRGFITAWKKS